MANDIIAAPELFVIKGRLFSFSPLSDYKNAELVAWLRWSCGNNVALESEEALAKFQTPEGAAKLLSISTGEPWDSAIDLIGDDLDCCADIYSNWLVLNLFEIDEPIKAEPSSTSPKIVKKDAVYTALASHYGWTVHEIRDMTPMQQYVFLKAAFDKAEAEESKTKFGTLSELQAYLASKKAEAKRG